MTGNLSLPLKNRFGHELQHVAPFGMLTGAFCMDFRGGTGLAWLGLAWLGLAWVGLAWLGLAPRPLGPFQAKPYQAMPSQVMPF